MKRFYHIIALLSILAVCPALEAAQNPRVVFQTNYGDIVIELSPDAAPVTVNNFLNYVNSGFYDGIVFHRSETIGRQTSDGTYIYTGSLDVLQTGWIYMIHGDFYTRQAGDPIINESYNGLSNIRGTLSMARTSEPNSATAQFFINHQNNTNLDKANYWDGYGYCVFGAVVEGMDVVDAIAQADIGILNDSLTFFPYNPYVIINLAYELPNSFSHSSNLVLNGRIDLEDFALFASHWLDNTCDSVNGYCSGADMDYSGQVNIADIAMFWNHWAQAAGYEPRFSDIYYDGNVEWVDLRLFISRWLDSDCHPDNNYCDRADINRDGRVDFVDYSLLGSNWQISY